MVRLSTAIPLADVEPLPRALGAWPGEGQPAGEATDLFRESAFPDDAAKIISPPSSDSRAWKQ